MKTSDYKHRQGSFDYNKKYFFLPAPLQDIMQNLNRTFQRIFFSLEIKATNNEIIERNQFEVKTKITFAIFFIFNIKILKDENSGFS